MDNLEKVHQKVADELGISRAKVKSIADSQFSFITTTMREKKFDDVRLKFLGIFKVKPGRLKYLGPNSKERIKQETDEYNHLL